MFSNQELVTTVENLVYDFLTWYPSHSRILGGRYEEDHPIAGKTSICGSSTEAELTSVKAQHHILFPDACIDQLDYFGIVDIRVSSKNDGLLLAQTLLRMKGEYDRVKKASILSKFEKNVFGGSLSHIVLSIDNLIDPLIASISGSENDLKESQAYCKRLIASATTVCYLIDIVMPSLPTNSISVPGSQGVIGAPLDIGRGNFVGEDTSSDSGTLLRNEYNGKLTRLGKASLLSGDMKCRKEDIRSTRDPLDLPICSYEWPELTKLMVRLSKYLNLKHDLPADKQTVNWTYSQITRESLKSTNWLTIFTALKRSFRFNLRCFAQFRLFFSIVMVFSSLIWWNSMVSSLLYIILFIGCSFFIYNGSFVIL